MHITHAITPFRRSSNSDGQGMSRIPRRVACTLSYNVPMLCFNVFDVCTYYNHFSIRPRFFTLQLTSYLSHIIFPGLRTNAPKGKAPTNSTATRPSNFNAISQLRTRERKVNVGRVRVDIFLFSPVTTVCCTWRMVVKVRARARLRLRRPTQALLRTHSPTCIGLMAAQAVHHRSSPF